MAVQNVIKEPLLLSQLHAGAIDMPGGYSVCAALLGRQAEVKLDHKLHRCMPWLVGLAIVCTVIYEFIPGCKDLMIIPTVIVYVLCAVPIILYLRVDVMRRLCQIAGFWYLCITCSACCN